MYYFAIKRRNEVLTHATRWVILENMLNERRQTYMATYYMSPFIGNIKNKQIHRDGK